MYLGNITTLSPAAVLVRATLAVPADDGVEGAGGDGVEDLRDQAEEAEVGGAVAGGPVAVELGLLGLGQDVEAEPQVLLLSQASHRGRVAVDRELEGGLDLGVGVLPGRRLDAHDDEGAVGGALGEVEAPDEGGVQNLAGL